MPSRLKVLILAFASLQISGGTPTPTPTPTTKQRSSYGVGKNACTGLVHLYDKCRKQRFGSPVDGICVTLTKKPGSTDAFGNMECLAVCGTPNAVDNAVTPVMILANDSDNWEGATYTYQCEANFSPQPGSSLDIYCLPNGTWTTPAFQCLPDCGPSPGDLFSNAAISQSSGTLVGDVTLYDCAADYAASGCLSAVCGDDGIWTPTDTSAICLPDCGAPPSNLFGSAASLSNTGGSTMVDGIAQYKCADGYTASGSLSAICVADRSWTKTDASARCIADCGAPTATVGAYDDFAYYGGSQTSAVAGTELSLLCDTGYIPKCGGPSIACDKGVWTSSGLGTCVPDPCDTAPAGYTLSGPGTATRPCPHGMGTQTITCGGSTWSGPTGVCR